MTAQLTGQRPVASPLQYSHQEDSPIDPDLPRVGSFVGLPPIRRTSTFGLLGNKTGPSDESGSIDSPIAPLEESTSTAPAVPSGMDTLGSDGPLSPVHYGQAQFQHIQSFPSRTPQIPTQGSMVNGQIRYNASAQPVPNGYSTSPNPDQNADLGPPQQQAFVQGPPQIPQQGPGREGNVPPGLVSQFNLQAQNGSPPPAGQPFVQGMRPGLSTTSPAGGNPIHRFPPQGQWKLEESHLSEPLNTARKAQNSPPTQQPGYYAEDKETESLNPGGPSQPPQRMTRNTGLPPVSAQRFPGLFPAGSSNQSPIQQDQIQIAPAAQRAQQQRRDSMGISRSSTQQEPDDLHVRQSSGLLNQIGGKFLPHRGRSDSLSKDSPSVQADEVSISETSVLTDEPREKKHKRASFFGLGNLGNGGPHAPAGPGNQFQQPSADPSASEKKKPFFSAGGLAKQKTGISSGKNDSASTNNDVNPGQGGGAKKRFSELKGILKGGPKDDQQLIKPESAQPSRPSMQGPSRPPTGASIAYQGPYSGQSPQYAQPGMMGPPPPVGRARSSTQGSVQGPPMPLPQHIAQLKPQHTGDGKDRKASTGGFLGNLFGNRPGSSAKDPKPQQSQQMPLQAQYTGQLGLPPGQQIRPGNMPPVSQPFAQRVVYPSQHQPGFPQGQQGQPNIFQGHPNGPGQYLAGIQGQQPGMLIPHRPHDAMPQTRQQQMAQPEMILGPEGAMMAMRQRSLSNLSAHGQQGMEQQQLANEQRPAVGHQPGSQATLKPEERETQLAPSSDSTTSSGDQQRNLAGPADEYSGRSSQDHLSVGGSSVLPRVSPNRKPVGSGPSRSSSGNIITLPSDASSAQSAATKPDILPQPSRSPDPSNEFGGDGQQGYAETSPMHRSPHLGAPPHAEHMRRPSLPTPSQSPIPGSPAAQMRLSSQPGLPQGSPLPQQQEFSRTPQGQVIASQPVRLSPGQPVGPQGQPGPSNPQGILPPGQAGRGQSMPQGPGPQQGQQPMAWGFTRTATGPPGQQQGLPQPSQIGGGPGPAQDQKGAMSKLFGGVGKRRESTGPQQPNSSQANQPKEKESASAKLFGAFKRSSKQDQPPVQQSQQSQAQQMPGPMMHGAIPGGRGQVPNPAVQSGQPGPPQIAQAARGQALPGAPFPPGVSSAPGQQQGPPQTVQYGRGQVPPPQIQGSRGQLPSQMRVGHGQISPTVMPMMQPHRSQTTAQRQEPQYAAVPIPRGYEAVHGYGVPNMVAHSPYNLGRGSPPQQYGPQFQPIVPQHTGASQQFSPMVPQHTGTSYQSQSVVPQHIGTSQLDPRGPPPAPSQQIQPANGQHQTHLVPQSGVPASAAQRYTQQPHAQGLPHLVPQHTGSPAPQQQSMFAQPPVSHSPDPQPQSFHPPPQVSPHPRPSDRSFLNPPSAQGSDQEPALQSQHESGTVEGGSGQEPRPQPQHIITDVHQPPDLAKIQHGNSPQNQPLPDSAATFSPVNSAAGRLPNPPLPPVNGIQDSHSQQAVANISHTPSPPAGAPTPDHHAVRQGLSNFSVHDELRSNSLSPDVAPHRPLSVSPEPSSQRLAPPQHPPNGSLQVNVNQANNHKPDQEDMYDATPRNEQAPRPQQTPIQNTTIRQYSDEAVPKSQIHVAAVAGGVAAGALASGDVSRSSSYQAGQTQQVHHIEPEEKILVDEPVELAAVNDDGDDLPMMSATSYPGQEWNPYGAGEFGDWE